MPSSPPESPKCDVLSSTSIYVTWSPPPIDSQNGKVKGYKVAYIAADEMYEKDAHVLKSTNQYLTVENLQRYTNYSVSVLAFTKIGDGVKTKQFFCTTHEDGNVSTFILILFNAYWPPTLPICSSVGTWRHQGNSCIKYKNYCVMAASHQFKWGNCTYYERSLVDSALFHFDLSFSTLRRATHFTWLNRTAPEMIRKRTRKCWDHRSTCMKRSDCTRVPHMISGWPHPPKLAKAKSRKLSGCSQTTKCRRASYRSAKALSVRGRVVWLWPVERSVSRCRWPFGVKMAKQWRQIVAKQSRKMAHFWYAIAWVRTRRTIRAASRIRGAKTKSSTMSSFGCHPMHPFWPLSIHSPIVCSSNGWTIKMAAAPFSATSSITSARMATGKSSRSTRRQTHICWAIYGAAPNINCISPHTIKSAPDSHAISSTHTPRAMRPCNRSTRKWLRIIRQVSHVGLIRGATGAVASRTLSSNANRTPDHNGPWYPATLHRPSASSPSPTCIQASSTNWGSLLTIMPASRAPCTISPLPVRKAVSQSPNGCKDSSFTNYSFNFSPDQLGSFESSVAHGRRSIFCQL